MSTITKSQLRRLSVTILLGSVILLPALVTRAPAQELATALSLDPAKVPHSRSAR